MTRQEARRIAHHIASVLLNPEACQLLLIWQYKNATFADKQKITRALTDLLEEHKQGAKPPEEVPWAGWADGRFFWHNDCINLRENDVEFRAVYDPTDNMECEECGRPLTEPPKGV